MPDKEILEREGLAGGEGKVLRLRPTYQHATDNKIEPARWVGWGLCYSE